MSTQIIYDLHELDLTLTMGLRDSLLAAFAASAAKPNRLLIRHVALALADLLIQLPEWTNAISGMIERFGQQVDTLGALLEFLTVAPEEAAENGRIDATVRGLMDHGPGLLMNIARLRTTTS